MLVKGITHEDFVNYKKPSMFIAFPSCTFKCEKECGVCCCQNSSLTREKSIDIDMDALIRSYIKNPITNAIVLGGLEPMDSYNDVAKFISKLRNDYHCCDMVVIYTGYNREEIKQRISELQEFKNIVIKFGRFIPNQIIRYDEVLGVTLASDNQYAIQIS